MVSVTYVMFRKLYPMTNRAVAEIAK
jgi:hypothetical protein